MRMALGLARRGLGRVWPNPAVGCVIVKDGRVVGRGWTQPGGRPHAETEAIERAGAGAAGATAYITLEPCAHHGKTPPCADALVAAKVGRAVIALTDPDPRVDGKGIARLKSGGIAVDVGVAEAEAAELNRGFILRLTENRPLVALKLGTTLDGRIATQHGESQWITGETARAFAHALRGSHDAVMIGSGTAVVDNPELTCRLPGMAGWSPVRVVLDGRLRLPLTHKLVAVARDVRTILLTIEGNPHDRLRAYKDCGVELTEIGQDANGNADLREGLAALAKFGLTRVLVEGGATLAASFMSLDLVDRIVWFRAPMVIGGDGIPAIVGFGVEALTDAKRFARLDARPAGADTMETYARA
jgi:diaminohydroxyphosphoribosylaminopyrimidine deaminase/5-amino-6-(5-phosphoribosylamino)uracil reductase